MHAAICSRLFRLFLASDQVFARAFLLGFAKTALKHYVELLARVLIGGSLLLVASGSAYASALSAFGWLLIGTTAVMTLVPWHVHDRFARSAVPKALRFLPSIGISSLLMGALLLWAIVASSFFRVSQK